MNKKYVVYKYPYNESFEGCKYIKTFIYDTLLECEIFINMDEILHFYKVVNLQTNEIVRI